MAVRVNQFIFEAGAFSRPNVRVNQFIFELGILPKVVPPTTGTPRITLRGVKRHKLACVEDARVSDVVEAPGVDRAV